MNKNINKVADIIQEKVVREVWHRISDCTDLQVRSYVDIQLSHQVLVRIREIFLNRGRTPWDDYLYNLLIYK